MNHFTKLAMISLLSGLLFITATIPSLGAQGVWELNFKGHSISAKFDGVPLETILAEIYEEKLIRYQVDETLLRKPITTEFRDLSLEDGLRRILVNMNYVLKFDSNKRLLGIFVAAKDTGKSGTSWGNYIGTRMNISSEEEPSEEPYTNISDEGISEQISNNPTSQASEEDSEEDIPEENPNIPAEQVVAEEVEEAPNIEDSADQELTFLPDDYQIE